MLTIVTEEAPAAVGPYAQAIKAGPFIFVSGQLPLDPATGRLAGNDAREQAAQCIRNVAAVLRAAGAGLENVVKTTVFLTNISDFAAVNEAYAAFFGAHKPARAAVQVAALPRNAAIEIEAIAFVSRGGGEEPLG
ncbi:MAG: RidA family protein [Bacillota bacterium]|nr:RidA family protein [Bacillota bacterium]